MASSVGSRCRALLLAGIVDLIRRDRRLAEPRLQLERPDVATWATLARMREVRGHTIFTGRVTGNTADEKEVKQRLQMK